MENGNKEIELVFDTCYKSGTRGGMIHTSTSTTTQRTEQNREGRGGRQASKAKQQHLSLSLSFILSFHSHLHSLRTSILIIINSSPMCDDHWVNFAMSDDSLVVDLLLRLHHPPPPTPTLNINWTVRQRRSRSVPNHHIKPDSTRASPTTPLSWSRATSPSGGAIDACEDSTRPTKLPQTSRSKVANLSGTATTKKSRKKKTLAELKEEENLLLKERKSLKSEFASLRLTVEKHRATNESLKRMKLDLESGQNTRTATTSDDSGKAVCRSSQFVETSCHPSADSVSPKTVTLEVPKDNSTVDAANNSSSQEIGNPEAKFALPDLNLPVEENFSPNSLH